MKVEGVVDGPTGGERPERYPCAHAEVDRRIVKDDVKPLGVVKTQGRRRGGDRQGRRRGRGRQRVGRKWYRRRVECHDE